MTINGGRYGLGSKDTTPADIISVFNNKDKKEFTVAINDDVTNLSLERGEAVSSTPESTVSCKFWGLGADGTVGANKNSSRSSVIIQINMLRHTLIMILRNQAVLQFPTYVSVMTQSKQHT